MFFVQMNILHLTQYKCEQIITSDKVKDWSDINTFGSDKQKSPFLLRSDRMYGVFLLLSNNLTNGSNNLTNGSDKCP